MEVAGFFLGVILIRFIGWPESTRRDLAKLVKAYRNEIDSFKMGPY